MNEPINGSVTAQFTEYARSFQPVGPKRFAKLLPFKDGITELRQKGASYRLIREALRALGVSVATDTLGQFCRELVDPPKPRTTQQRKVGRSVNDSDKARTASRHETASTPSPVPVTAPVSVPTIVPPRTRGPRIADPSTL